MASVNIQTQKFTYKGFIIIVNFVGRSEMRVRVPKLRIDTGWTDFAPEGLRNIKDAIDLR